MFFLTNGRNSWGTNREIPHFANKRHPKIRIYPHSTGIDILLPLAKINLFACQLIFFRCIKACSAAFYKKKKKKMHPYTVQFEGMANQSGFSRRVRKVWLDVTVIVPRSQATKGPLSYLRPLFCVTSCAIESILDQTIGKTFC